MNIKAALSCIFISIFLSVSCLAADHPLGLNENHPYGRLTSEYVTPHVKWANPYYGGEVKTLVMAPAWSQRETVELAQRLSLNYTAWMTSDFSSIYEKTADDPAAAFFQWSPDLSYGLLRRYLQGELDVIIIGKLDWKTIPSRERFELLKKVSEGTGLIYICPPSKNPELDLVFGKALDTRGVNFITRNIPISALPQFKGIRPVELVRATLFGKGRVVTLNYRDKGIPEQYNHAAPSLTPVWDNTDYIEENPSIANLPEMEFVPHEYYHALLAKAVLWAGKREPVANIKSVMLPSQMTWPISGRKVSVNMENAPSGALMAAKIRDRYEYDLVYDLGRAKAERIVSFTLPDIPAGEYFLDIWLLSQDGETIDWMSSALSICADFSFADISLGSTQYNVGDNVSGTITLSRPPAKNESIVVELWDNYKRLIQSRRLDVSGTRIEFIFDSLEPLTIMHRVNARLMRDGKEVCSSKLDFPVRAKLRRDDFNEIAWASADNWVTTHLMLRKLTESDQTDVIDIGWRGATMARNIASANASVMPYVARYGAFGSSQNHIVPEIEGSAYGCMSSPVTYKGVDDWADKYSKIYGPYGPFAWTHGDETFYSLDPDICWSTTCLAAFRSYLKEVYSDLDALNVEWKRTYTSWEEVMPITFKEAVQTGNYAPWIEHRLSASRVFAKFYQKTGESLSGGDADARAGFDGPAGLVYPNSGINWWLLSSHVGILQDYINNSEGMELLRSFAKPGQVTGMWYGTYGLTWQLGPNTVEYCHFFPWYSLFHGLNTTWFWTMGQPGRVSGYAPDLTSLPFFESRTQALKQIKSGIGKLLLTGERSNDKIAIHYSDVSRIADSLYGEGRSDYYVWGSLANFNKALEDSGLQYEYVSYEEVANGELIGKGYKALIMPHSRSVSVAEAEQIRRFVSEGGVVIADLVPGMLNGHGTRQETGMLADLFPSETAVTVTSYGQGKTILVGGLLNDYGRSHNNMNGWKKWAHLDKNRAELVSLLKTHAGIEPAAKITPLKADRMPPTEVTSFQCGDITYISFLREYFVYDNVSYEARIELPKTMHIYDVRSGRYLGKTNRIDTSISYEAHLYAMSPYKVEKINLSTDGKVTRAKPSQVRIALKTSEGVQPSKHAFRVEVISPDGKNIAHYAQNILAENGNVITNIPWALNDKPGRYTIIVRDVMSGSTARRTIALK